MSDSIVDFPLRDANRDGLAVSLGRCFAECNLWHGHATLVCGFAQDADMGGVKDILAARLHQMLDFCEAKGFIYSTSSQTRTNREIARTLADHQLGIADHGVRIAAIVMLHNAYERFLWRLVRFGMVANRAQAVKWIANRNVTVETLMAKGIDEAVDGHLEKWWNELERGTLLDKWDRLCGLFGCPDKLIDPPWRFDRPMLVDFDHIRHNAVHRDARAIKEFDLRAFADQLSRAQWVWLSQIATRLGVRIPVESLFKMD